MAAAPFSDRERAEKILNEVGLAINLVNTMLTAESFPPFSVLVGGHTSQTTDKSQLVSMSRATSAAALLAEKLAAIAPEEYEGTADQIWVDGDAHTPKGSFIRAEGFGASQRLPGYDDGGNYDQNRRVEITLVVGDGIAK